MQPRCRFCSTRILDTATSTTFVGWSGSLNSAAGACLEDKVFPKTNSLLEGERQTLADIDEFAGKIKAAKDTQQDSDFCVVARIESFIAGWGLNETLDRANAYHEAGADALLIHSKLAVPDE